MREIGKLLEIFTNKFPKDLVPLHGDKEPEKHKKAEPAPITRRLSALPSLDVDEKQKKSQSTPVPRKIVAKSFLSLKSKHLKMSLELLKSEDMSKFVGLFVHFAYWVMLGRLHIQELGSFEKKQILIHMYRLMNEFHRKFKVY